ncbi:MAG TPA: roadblock/LC7 domain-containing protein [Longimicrobium sp.]|nr:roadblock/LC7 domain-containing protein [Longimicrobium sp.]
MTATPQQVRQWSDELAADPASLAFLPLARAYREMGRGDAATRLCLRGLERHPNHVDAHHLLGLLYREGGEGLKAADEWGIVLALAPEHSEARRELGFGALARGDWAAAIRHLEIALANDVTDGEVREALEKAWARRRGDAPTPPRVVQTQPAASVEPAAATESVAPTEPATTAKPAPIAEPAPPVHEVAVAGWDGGREFDAVAGEFRALGGERGMVGAVLLDAQGFVVAGEMRVGGRDRAGEIAAVLSGASSEAERAVRLLDLGVWKGIVVETPEAVVRLAPTSDGGMVAVAGRREVPMGWVLRVAGRARDAAERFLVAMESGS